MRADNPVDRIDVSCYTLDMDWEEESRVRVDQQTVYLFRCRQNVARFGATADRTGSNLPPQGGRGDWEPHSSIILEQTVQPRAGLDERELRSHLDRNGFYVWEARITTTLRDG